MMRQRMTGKRLLGGLCLWLAVFGCDNGIEVFPEDPDRAFNIHGYIYVGDSLSLVRVTPLRPGADAEAADDRVQNLQVISEDLVTGEQVAWRDTVLTVDDTSAVRLYYADFRGQPDRPYRLTVSDGEGRTTTATTRTPSLPALDVGEPSDLVALLRLPLTLEGLRQAATNIEIEYQAALVTGRDSIRIPPDTTIVGSDTTITPAKTTYFVTDVGPLETISRVYDTGGQLLTQGWVMNVRLSTDRDAIYAHFNKDRFEYRYNCTDVLDPPLFPIYLDSITVRFDLKSAEWQKVGTEENIEQGHGFFGSYATYEQRWKLSDEVQECLWFAIR